VALSVPSQFELRYLQIEQRIVLLDLQPGVFILSEKLNHFGVTLLQALYR
jgi:hypothetical protein